MPRRIIDITGGMAMVVTDLHGEWDAYRRYRDRFLALRQQGQVDRWLLCGDLIHKEGPAHTDASLAMILDVIRLQAELGPDAVTMLTGNHEFPHVYGFTLSKGAIEYTPRFERALTDAGSDIRMRVIEFIDRLPFYVRTAAGVMVAHCGASPLAALPENRQKLTDFNHLALCARIDQVLAQAGWTVMRRKYCQLAGVDYDEDVVSKLAVSGPDDPRYHHLLRELVLDHDADFNLLWDAFYTLNERGMAEDVYRQVLAQFLLTWSEGAPTAQGVLISGHIAVLGGYKIIDDRQLRIGSWSHANPKESGLYLLLDCARPVTGASDLLPCLASVFM